MEIQSFAKKCQKTVSMSARDSKITIEPFTLYGQDYPETKIDLARLQSDDDNLIVRIYADQASGDIVTGDVGLGDKVWQIIEIDLPIKTYHSEPDLDEQKSQIIDDDDQPTTHLVSDNLEANALSVRLFGLE